MEKTNLVSIIIPCYNQAQYLRDSVISAMNQTYSDIEIIIVNDGSPDNTQDIAEKLQDESPAIIKIFKQKNSGLYAARNTGIKKASGSYIVPLDADDKLDVTMVEKCMYLIEKTHADIVYTGYQGFGMSEDSNLWRPFEETNPLYMTPCSATALFKKEVWKETGGYSAVMHDGYEDWEFWVNAYKNGFIFKHLSEKLFLYRTKEESMYVTAYKKDAYLKAKIVLSHPEMYPRSRVRRSIDIIKETELLSDIYFYYHADFPNNEAQIKTILESHFASISLHDVQSKKMKNANLELYKLDDIHNEAKMQELLQNAQEKVMVFYADMCYNITELKLYNFSWNMEKGMVNTEGTLFPYVFSSKKNDSHLQELACEHLERFEAFNQNRIRTLLYKMNDLNQKVSNFNHIMNSLAKFFKLATLMNPLKKIKTYKELLSVYQLCRTNEIIIQKNDKITLFTVIPAKKNIQIAFYLYKNNIHIDTQWYSKNLSYTLDTTLHSEGIYKVKYFIVDDNIKDPGKSTEKIIGYSQSIDTRNSSHPQYVDQF